ncbi:hypothetical protein CDD82_1100 [Ophiocordyceps australis]|uniref:Protein YTP1-like C-terminal domain-containing protein n=1 Tax=Ophiocordyceps australis TaxID=1399860 RepID=A0A2C5YKL5_9HYPO|nr:hypothetical protein CDD82_1100 [Ophiocordyceps australis]
MTFAWVVILPVAVMLSLVGSRFTIHWQSVFTITHVVGLLFVIMYKADTPDLYPHNAHYKIGWIATGLVPAQMVIGLAEHMAASLRRRSLRRAHLASAEERCYFIPDGEYRISSESCHNIESNTDALPSSWDTTLQAREQDLDKECDSSNPQLSRSKLSLYRMRISRQLAVTVTWLVSSRTWWCFDLLYRITDRIILPFGFAVVTTGIATFGRFFEGHAIFSGLAHWIKGGVFFWLGLFTLGRWCGSFAELGWAWNARPRARRTKWYPSIEFVESALIFLYGSTNIFLEHLGRWGGDWTAQDLQHLAITILFIGGGLCGMLVESAFIRRLLNMTASQVSVVPIHDESVHEERQQPDTYQFSLNPIPALVILMVGVIMSSHHQSSHISTTVHKQWGNLLLGASFARTLTYILIYLRPPKSTLPSRPPTELLAAFGLIAGGIIFMASSSDTIQAIIDHDLDAMFIYTITMGLVALLMAWEVLVLASKGWAAHCERRLIPSQSPVNHLQGSP